MTGGKGAGVAGGKVKGRKRQVVDLELEGRYSALQQRHAQTLAELDQTQTQLEALRAQTTQDPLRELEGRLEDVPVCLPEYLICTYRDGQRYRIGPQQAAFASWAYLTLLTFVKTMVGVGERTPNDPEALLTFVRAWVGSGRLTLAEINRERSALDEIALATTDELHELAATTS